MSAPTGLRLDAHRRITVAADDLVTVEAGVVEVFLISDQSPPVAPRHLGTLTAGHRLPGLDWAGELAANERIELVGNGPAVARCQPGAAGGADTVDDELRRAELTARIVAVREPDASPAVIGRRVAADNQRGADANDALGGVLDRNRGETTGVDSAVDLDATPRLRALLLAAEAAGLRLPARSVQTAAVLTNLDVPQLAGRLRAPVREVDLGGAWWTEDSPPMVAVADDGTAYALIRRGRQWQAWSAPSGWRPVTGPLELARAWCVYPTFPERAVGARDLLRVGLPPTARNDLLRLAGTAVAVMTLGAAVPLATARILGDAAPRAEAGNIVAIGALVAGLILAFTAASVAQGLLLQRLVTQLNVRTTAALWARVVRLEPPFFRAYNPGELARRVLAVDGIRELITSSVLTGGIGLLIGVTGVVVTFVLDVWIGVTVVAGLALFAGFSWWQLRALTRARRGEVNARNGISGFVTAALTGIVKVRVADAEQRMYARWGAMFAKEQTHAARAAAAQRQLTVVTAVSPAVATLIVLAVVTYGHQADLSIGVFVGLVAALSQVTTALSLITPALGQLADAAPLYDAARPVLQTAPRPATDAADPGALRGKLEVSKVSFAYTDDGPRILNEVDLQAAPGEFVAVVGPSGAGKSTLIRLLLGFDRPSAGAVLFDGKPLDTLDLEAVRRQVGVVMQNAQVPTGSLLTALVGTTNLTQDQAWEALDMAGLAEDVRAMPMGIRTVISEGASTFSGGQRQRLMIARALIRRPRVLIFDEATSALDNLTQQTVTRSLENLDATRIVIAHRLSTIRDAHRIYVLDRGAVVESGDFDALMSAGGVFAALARRQLA
ncbi:ATP-binding cassette domain-containing protein [Pilimelia columellifera]|uniref:NHLP bacteriocin export ABC transporter permease/ATPase subunit n=1 Tax=Pilimelia columellifera subsp. columellifera TaxID=706583 RepID=A0ABP6AZH2_9ACTN